MSTQSSRPILNSPLVAPTEVLAAFSHLSSTGNGGRIRLVDASWHLPTPNAPKRDALAEHHEQRCSGATFFDLDAVSDTTSELPHMLPSAEHFSKACSAQGICREDCVVVYGCPGTFSAPRVWWTFKCFGHREVHVLNGGLKAWIEAGGGTEGTATTADEAGGGAGGGEGQAPSYQGAALEPSFVATWKDVLSASSAATATPPPPAEGHATESGPAAESTMVGSAPQAVILDARPPARFLGTTPEPRPGLRSGHVPNSRNLPVTSVLREGDPTSFKTAEECRAAFAAVGVGKDTDLLTTCGSGVTAAVLSFAHYYCFFREEAARQEEEDGGAGRHSLASSIGSRVYDGSWSEWGGRGDLPVVK